MDLNKMTKKQLENKYANLSDIHHKLWLQEQKCRYSLKEISALLRELDEPKKTCPKCNGYGTVSMDD